MDARKPRPEVSPQSNVKIIFFAAACSFGVLVASLMIQWLVYDDWLHKTGPLRIIGSSIATLLAFGFVVRWQLAVRERDREMLARFEQIAQMNDRIRNALQAIELVTYAAQSAATEPVQDAVQSIDNVLTEVLTDVRFRRPVSSAKIPVATSQSKERRAAHLLALERFSAGKNSSSAKN